MASQNIINLTAIIIISIFLWHFNNQIQQVSSHQLNIINLSKKIMKGETIDEQDITNIKQIVDAPYNSSQNDGLRCYLQIYHEVIINKHIQINNLFQILSQGKGQYNNVKTCPHFISLLLYKTHSSSLQDKIKSTVIQILNRKLKDEFNQRYLSSTLKDKIKDNDICVIKYAKNGQSTIESQIISLINQEYKKFNVYLQIDGSKDKAHMLAQFTYNKYKSDKKCMQIHNDGQEQGFIKRMKYLVQQKCQKGSIVLILQRDSIMLSSQIFDLLNIVFQNDSTKMVVFNSLTTNHTNIHDQKRVFSQKQIAQSSDLYPVIAFQRQSLINTIKNIQTHKEVNNIYTSQYQFYIFLNDLLRKNIVNPKQRRYIDQAVSYRVQRSRIQSQRLIQQLVKY